MTPEWGRAGGELPPETQFLLLELGARGPYAVLLPLIDNSVFRATLRRRAAVHRGWAGDCPCERGRSACLLIAPLAPASGRAQTAGGQFRGCPCDSQVVKPGPAKCA